MKTKTFIFIGLAFLTMQMKGQEKTMMDLLTAHPWEQTNIINGDLFQRKSITVYTRTTETTTSVGLDEDGDRNDRLFVNEYYLSDEPLSQIYQNGKVIFDQSQVGKNQNGRFLITPYYIFEIITLNEQELITRQAIELAGPNIFAPYHGEIPKIE